MEVGGQPEALIAVRYERDTSDLKKILFARHALVVDEVLLSPSVPARLRMLLHAAIVQSLVQLGEFHGMTVAFLEDFDI